MASRWCAMQMRKGQFSAGLAELLIWTMVSAMLLSSGTGRITFFSPSAANFFLFPFSCSIQAEDAGWGRTKSCDYGLHRRRFAYWVISRKCDSHRSQWPINGPTPMESSNRSINCRTAMARMHTARHRDAMNEWATFCTAINSHIRIDGRVSDCIGATKFDFFLLSFDRNICAFGRHDLFFSLPFFSVPFGSRMSILLFWKRITVWTKLDSFLWKLLQGFALLNGQVSERSNTRTKIV